MNSWLSTTEEVRGIDTWRYVMIDDKVLHLGHPSIAELRREEMVHKV